MNNFNLKEITILKTWKWEEFEIEMRYEDFLIFENNLKSNWEDWFDSKKYRRFIKFSSIEDKIWKTKYLSLPEPKQKNNKLYTEEEKRKSREFHKKILEKTFEWRKKNFIYRRNETLKRLAIEEKSFWIETTIDKIQDLMKYRKANIKNYTLETLN